MPDKRQRKRLPIERRAIPVERHLFREPDHAKFENPFDSPDLIAYYQDIFKWHGYIKFLGMPHLMDTPDVIIDNLYVEPFTGPDYISTDVPPSAWSDKRAPLVQTLAENPRLVLLGDPGSGKSTLVSWLAYQLTRPVENPYVAQLGRLVPFPFVLRELSIKSDVTWESLLDSFLTQPVARALGSRERAEEILQRGQALIMLDGLDEIGSAATRKALREAVHRGFTLYPQSRWLLTSRIIGYEQVPFEHEQADEADEFYDQFSMPRPGKEWASVRHVAPFDDAQIRLFARNWFALRERADDPRRPKAEDLVEAIKQDERTQRLARIPNILAFMALIYRVRAQLPHGRAVLYNQITEAYLESIDRYRGLDCLNYSLSQKRRWLARVGFEMQLLRSQADDENDDSTGILVSEPDLLKWITDAMGGEQAAEDARRFIDYVGRRSGILIPRGDGVYAFVHLSFQEYFAAYYLMEEITSPRRYPREIKKWVDDSTWTETFTFLFELLAENSPDWVTDLYKKLFPDVKRKMKPSAAALLASISVDPHSGLSDTTREESWRRCWDWHISESDNPLSKVHDIVPPVLLPAASDYSVSVTRSLAEALSGHNCVHLFLRDCPGLTDLSTLAGLAELRILDLYGCSGISDLSPLSGLTNVILLYLDGCVGVSDLSPLAGMSNLDVISLKGCHSVSDLSPLAGLSQMMEIYLTGCTGVFDLSPLAGLVSVRSLDLSEFAHISDLSPLSNLTELRRLHLNRCTGISDLSPLASLANLLLLDLTGCTGISDLSPLASLANLLLLDLTGCTNIRSIPLSLRKVVSGFGEE